MGYFDKYHVFRDPIHGFIKVYDLEREIINSKAFQRLRRIRQLGLTNLVYHGAEHSRFGHSIGVMEIADRIFHVIVAKDHSSNERLLRKEAKWKKGDFDRNRITLRLVALMHDIGHCPFSHGSEKLFSRGNSHEEMSAKIVENDPEILQIINGLRAELEIKNDYIADIIRKKIVPPIISQIISGPLDADKIDYLWRDSFFAGVHYGRFDSDRLVNTMTIVFDKVAQEVALGIEEGGYFAAESLMLARFYMFMQVYFHEKRRAFDNHLTEFLRTQLPRNIYPNNIKKYLALDDNVVFSWLTKSGHSKNPSLRDAKAILERNPSRRLAKTSVFAEDKEVEVFKRSFERIRRQFSGEHIFMDSANEAPNKFKKERVYIKRRHTSNMKMIDKYSDIEKISDLIKKLDDKIQMLRIYVPGENLIEIKKFADKLPWRP